MRDECELKTETSGPGLFPMLEDLSTRERALLRRLERISATLRIDPTKPEPKDSPAGMESACAFGETCHRIMGEIEAVTRQIERKVGVITDQDMPVPDFGSQPPAHYPSNRY